MNWLREVTLYQRQLSVVPQQYWQTVLNTLAIEGGNILVIQATSAVLIRHILQCTHAQIKQWCVCVCVCVCVCEGERERETHLTALVGKVNFGNCFLVSSSISCSFGYTDVI